MKNLFTYLMISILACLLVTWEWLKLTFNVAAAALHPPRRLALIVPAWLLALLVMWSAPRASAQFTPNYFKQDTNASLVISNGQGRAVSGYKFTIRQNRGVSLFARIVSTNATATTATAGANVYLDNTNGTTTQPIQWAIPASLVGTNWYWTNWPASQLSNVRSISIGTVTNNSTATVPGSNSVQLQFFWSQDNQ